VLGTLKDASGTYGAGLGVIAGGTAVALVCTLVLRGVWRTGWTSGAAVGVKV
jgi:hypothetical protein